MPKCEAPYTDINVLYVVYHHICLLWGWQAMPIEIRHLGSKPLTDDEFQGPEYSICQGHARMSYLYCSGGHFALAYIRHPGLPFPAAKASMVALYSWLARRDLGDACLSIHPCAMLVLTLSPNLIGYDMQMTSQYAGISMEADCGTFKQGWIWW